MLVNPLKSNFLLPSSLPTIVRKTSYVLSLVLILLFAARPEAQAQKKKLSPQAKGTIIGAGAGALGGALINKRNRAAGGVIGGVIGAGAGYAVGKHVDNKQKRARVAAANRAAAERATAQRAAAARAAAPERSNAAAPTPAPARAGGTPAAVLAAGYLPNSAYGERDTPYPNSEYRRKSW